MVGDGVDTVHRNVEDLLNAVAWSIEGSELLSDE